MWKRARPATDDFEAPVHSRLRQSGWSSVDEKSPHATPFPGRFLFGLDGNWESSAWIHVIEADRAESAPSRRTAFLLGVDAGLTYPPAERLLANLGVRTSNLTAPAPERFAGDFENDWIELASPFEAAVGADRIARFLEDVVVPWARRSASIAEWDRRALDAYREDGGEDPEAFVATGRIAMHLAHDQTSEALAELDRLDRRLIHDPSQTEAAFSAITRQRIASGIEVPDSWAPAEPS